jgi:hypothetical protein
MEYTEKSMQDALRGFLSNPVYIIKNLYVFNWESDMLFLTRAGYWYEIEIKISRSDFFNDSKKCTGYNHLKSDVLTDPAKKGPNFFYYAIPKGMITLSELPTYAGLIEVDNGYYTVKVKAPRLRKTKLDRNCMGLQDKFYFNWKNAEVDIKRMAREIQDIRRHYNDAEQSIIHAVNKAKEKERNAAIEAFMICCPHYDSILNHCTKKDRKSYRCGWCKRYKQFEDEIFKEITPIQTQRRS